MHASNGQQALHHTRNSKPGGCCQTNASIVVKGAEAASKTPAILLQTRHLVVSSANTILSQSTPTKQHTSCQDPPHADRVHTLAPQTTKHSLSPKSHRPHAHGKRQPHTPLTASSTTIKIPHLPPIALPEAEHPVETPAGPGACVEGGQARRPAGCPTAPQSHGLLPATSAPGQTGW